MCEPATRELERHERYGVSGVVAYPARGRGRLNADRLLAEQGHEEVHEMDACLVQRPLQHLPAPAGFGPWGEVHELPDLHEHQVPDIRPGHLITHRAKNRHLAELVI